MFITTSTVQENFSLDQRSIRKRACLFWIPTSKPCTARPKRRSPTARPSMVPRHWSCLSLSSRMSAQEPRRQILGSEAEIKEREPIYEGPGHEPRPATIALVRRTRIATRHGLSSSTPSKAEKKAKSNDFKITPQSRRRSGTKVVEDLGFADSQ